MKRKTSKGKLIDLEALIANQPVSPPAVGNMNVNANGDVLGNGGEVVQNNTNRVRSYYKQNPKSSTHQVSLKDPLDYSIRDSVVADAPLEEVIETQELDEFSNESEPQAQSVQPETHTKKPAVAKKSSTSKKSSKATEPADIEVINEQGDIVMMTASEFLDHTQQANNG
jgi:hypothetical protein